MRRIAFILFHTGETTALLPTMLKMAGKPEKYEICIVPVGQAARGRLPDELAEFIRTPSFVAAGKAANDEFQKEFSPECIQEVLALCETFNNVVIGFPSKLQAQIAQALPHSKQRIIYFDAGNDEAKIETFAPFSNTLVFTTLANHSQAQAFISDSELSNKPQVVPARHGDFDRWRYAYKSMTEERFAAIRASLDVSSTDKVILWAGGYGDNFSAEDAEAIAFRLFIETFKLYQQYFKLRITLHPGIKNTYSAEKLKSIQDTYYLQPLLNLGFSADEVSKVITQLDTLQVASVSLGVVSSGSTVAPQAVLIGTRAKNIIPDSHPPLFQGIEDVNTPARLSLLLERWAYKDRRQPGDGSYENAVAKLGIPKESTKHVIKRHTLE